MAFGALMYIQNRQRTRELENLREQLDSCIALANLDSKSVEVSNKFVDETIDIIKDPTQLIVMLFTGEVDEAKMEQYGMNVGNLATHFRSDEMKGRGELLAKCTTPVK